MNIIREILAHFAEAFRWFFILQPWEQGVRVRAGKVLRRYQGGLHFKIPYLDVVHRQNVRIRIAGIRPVNVTTLDAQLLTVAGSLEYVIEDLLLMQTKVHNPEETICQKVQYILARTITESELYQCAPERLIREVMEEIDFSDWGLTSVRFQITDFVSSKAYRLITGEIDGKWFHGQIKPDGGES